MIEWQIAIGNSCGTELYLAPEVAREGPKYTNIVDIWSLGTVVIQFAYSFPPALREWNTRDWTGAINYHAHSTFA
jgi:serine/threonine protein kinase